MNSENSIPAVELKPRPTPTDPHHLKSVDVLDKILIGLSTAITMVDKDSKAVDLEFGADVLQVRQNRLKGAKVKLSEIQKLLGDSWTQVNNFRLAKIKNKTEKGPNIKQLTTEVEALKAELQKLKEELGE